MANSVRDNINEGIYYTQIPLTSGTMDEIRAQREARRRDGNRLQDIFKYDALAEVGLADHPNADKIYNYAWDKGHASGLLEVLQELEELSELFN